MYFPEYENLGDTSFKTDNAEYKNVCLVGGEGDGIARRTESVNLTDEEPSDTARFEMFLDESSLSIEQETEVEELIYRKQLQSAGLEELKNITTTEFEGDVVLETYTYKQDYNLGDLVYIRDKYGNEANQRIREITETWDVNGYSLEISFSED